MSPLTRLRFATIACALALLAAACVEAPGGATGPCRGDDVHLGADGVLVVGAELSTPPFAFLDGGEPAGFDVDVLRAVGERLAVEVRFEDRGFSSLVPGLLSNSYDAVASGVRATEELADQACLTEPYLEAHPAVIVTGDAPGGPDDLAGRAVAVQEGTPEARWAADVLSAASVRLYPTPEDPLEALRRDEAHAAVAPAPVAFREVEADGGLSVAFTGDGDGPYVFAVAPSNGALKGALDEALGALRDDGTHAELYERWFGRPPPE